MNSVIFDFVTLEEQNSILSVCDYARKNPTSRKNLSYIVSSFSNFIEKSPFSSTYDDICSYTAFLQSQCRKKLLKESYCYVVFLELRSFFFTAEQLHVLQNPSPFTDFKNPFHWNYGEHTALPTFEDLDVLLSLSADNIFLTLAILLAFRMTLPISEIVSLRRSDVIINKKDGQFYLKAQRYVEEQQQEAYLLIPEDLLPLIKESILSSPDTSADANPYLVRSPRCQSASIRSLQRLLAAAQSGSGLSITFSCLRSFGIYVFLASKVPLDLLCSYSNISPQRNWFSMYTLPDKLCLDACSYVHFRTL